MYKRRNYKAKTHSVLTTRNVSTWLEETQTRKCVLFLPLSNSLFFLSFSLILSFNFIPTGGISRRLVSELKLAEAKRLEARITTGSRAQGWYQREGTELQYIYIYIRGR